MSNETNRLTAAEARVLSGYAIDVALEEIHKQIRKAALSKPPIRFIFIDQLDLIEKIGEDGYKQVLFDLSLNGYAVEVTNKPIAKVKISW